MTSHESAADSAPDFAQLLKLIKDTYQVSESEIARRIGVSAAAVNSWVRRTRGGGRGPKPENLRKLSQAFPKFSEDVVFAAAGRKAPGPLSPDARERLLALFEGLTAEQQRSFEVQIRALVDDNRSSF